MKRPNLFLHRIHLLELFSGYLSAQQTCSLLNVWFLGQKEKKVNLFLVSNIHSEVSKHNELYINWKPENIY